MTQAVDPFVAGLAALVTDRLRKVEGITRTQTLIAFRAYSKHDLDSLFGLD